MRAPLSLAAALALFSPSVYAQTLPNIDYAEEADLHFNLAIDDYREGDYEAALEHLLHSNRLAPNRNVVFNIARCYEKLGQFDQAYRHYADYVALETDPAMRVEAEAALNRISGQVALVRVESSPPGATVYVDRKDLGARGVTPLTLALPPGQRQLILELEGHKPNAVTAELAKGKKVEATGSLERILGTVVLEGGPPGADVHLEREDGERVGSSPGELRLPPGRHVLVITMPGYRPQREVVTVTADEVTRARVSMAVLSGALVVNAVEQGATIKVDDEVKGFTPAVIELPAGDHIVKVEAPGFRPFEERVRIEADGRATVDVSLRSVAEVTAASRTLRTTEEAPASVSVITREEIRAFGYQSVVEALSGQRGVYPTDDLSYSSIGVRGYARSGDYGNRVLVTMDGHTLNDDLLGGSYVGGGLVTDLHDLDRIELVRGPGSALYGSNAFLGVVNLVSAKESATQGPQVAVTGDGQRGARARARVGLGDDDRGAWLSASGQVAQGGDVYFPEYAAVVSADGIIRGADGSRGGTLHAKAWTGDLTVQAFYNSFNKQYPTGAFDTIPGDPEGRNLDQRAFAEVRYEPRLGDVGRLYARAYLDQYRYDGFYPYAESDEYPAYTLHDQWRGTWVGVEPRAVFDLGTLFQLTLGAEARRHLSATLTGEELIAGENEATYLTETPIQTVLSAYGVGELKLGRVLMVSVGGRYDYFTLAEVGGTFNPRLAIIAQPTENDVIKLLAGTAFRAPSAYELFYNDGGITQDKAESLSPERVRTGELEYNHRFSDVITGTAAGYYNEIESLIDTRVVGLGEEGEVFEYTNTQGVVRSAGTEIELRRDWRQGMMLAGQTSLQRTRQGSLSAPQELTNSPTVLVGARAAAPFVIPGSTLATRARVESPRLTSAEERTEWALLWDLTLTGVVPSTGLSWGLGARNLLDWQQTHPGGLDLPVDAVPQAGRTYFATLRLDL